MKRSHKIVAAASLAALALSLAAYVTYKGNPRWPLSGGFHYVVDLNTTSFPKTHPDFKQALYTLSDWHDMGSTSFRPGYRMANPDYTNHGDGRNAWVWRNEPKSSWLGITFVRWSGSTMKDCDIWYNSRSDYKWAFGLLDPCKPRPYWPVDFRAIARHETGHAIGFDHENRTLSNLNSTYQHGNGVQHVAGSGMMPHATDKAGCRVLYPAAGTTRNLMATRWREPSKGSSSARWLDTAGTWAAGTTRKVQSWLENQTNGTISGGASGVHVGIYLSKNTFISTLDTRVAEYYFTRNWAAHSAGYYNLSARAPSSMTPGTYYVGVIFDNTRKVAEKFETDNACVVGKVTVTNVARTLVVRSTNPSSGVLIAVSRKDRFGKQNGTTAFSRSYWNGQSTILTAPATFGSNPFKRWVLDGAGKRLGVRTLTVPNTRSSTAVAEYSTHVHGLFLKYGLGCAGGGRRILAHSGMGHPDIGSRISLLATNAAPNALGTMLQGAASTSISLAPIGMRTCWLYVAHLATTLPFTTSAVGIGSITLTLPNSTAVIGQSFYTQAAVIDLGAPHALKVVASNGLRTKVGGTKP